MHAASTFLVIFRRLVVCLVGRTAMLSGIALILLVVGASHQALGVTLVPGSVILAGSRGEIAQVVLATGAKTVVYTDPLLRLQGIAVGPDGSTVYFSHRDTTGTSVQKLNVHTGFASVLSTGAPGDSFSNPLDLVVSGDGSNLYLVDSDSGALFGIDTTTGATTVRAAVVLPIDLWQESSGSLAVLAQAPGAAAVFRVDPISSVVTQLSSGLNLGSIPQGSLAIDPISGLIYQSGNSFQRFLEIDPISGAQNMVASFPAGSNDMAWDWETESLLVSVNGYAGTLGGFFTRLEYVDPVTGARTLAYEEFFGQANDARYQAFAMVPVPEPSTALLVLACGLIMFAAPRGSVRGTPSCKRL